MLFLSVLGHLIGACIALGRPSMEEPEREIREIRVEDVVVQKIWLLLAYKQGNVATFQRGENSMSRRWNPMLRHYKGVKSQCRDVPKGFFFFFFTNAATLPRAF